MFDQIKAMGAIAGLLKDKARLREAGARVRSRLADARVEGVGGSGAVRAVVDGQVNLVRVTIDPVAAESLARSREAIEGMIVEAVNDASARARVLARETIEREARSLGLDDALPGIRDALGGLAG